MMRSDEVALVFLMIPAVVEKLRKLEAEER